MKMYLAIYDNGSSTGSFEFYSKHRARSENNREDARMFMNRKYGKISRNWIIKSTHLQRDE